MAVIIPLNTAWFTSPHIVYTINIMKLHEVITDRYIKQVLLKFQQELLDAGLEVEELNPSNLSLSVSAHGESYYVIINVKPGDADVTVFEIYTSEGRPIEVTKNASGSWDALWGLVKINGSLAEVFNSIVEDYLMRRGRWSHR